VNINERVIEAEKTKLIITEQRESYRSVACRGSLLYFVIADLAHIDPMYQYSLEFFQKLFNKRLAESESSEEKEKRIMIVIDDLTVNFYINICRGLFEKDKLLYSFLNTVSIMKNMVKIGDTEWNFFLRGTTNDYSKHNAPATADFMTDTIW
jgi:dynein heavy chain